PRPWPGHGAPGRPGRRHLGELRRDRGVAGRRRGGAGPSRPGPGSGRLAGPGAVRRPPAGWRAAAAPRRRAPPRGPRTTGGGGSRPRGLAIGTGEGISTPTGEPRLDRTIQGTCQLVLGSGPDLAGPLALTCDLRTAGGIDLDGAPLLREGRLVA